MSNFTLHELDESFKRIWRDPDTGDGIDTETGEVLDEAMLDSIEMDRKEKFIACAIVYKNLGVEAEAFKAEKMRLARIQSQIEKKRESLADYMSRHMEEGEKISTPQASLSWRKSQQVIVNDIDGLPEAFKKYKVDADKTALKAALKAGEVIPGATLEDINNLQIK